MTPRLLAIDYDGVIADTNSMKSEWIGINLGLDIPPWKCDRTHCVPLIGERPYDDMGDFVYGGEASSQANPVPGALQGIKRLVHLGWEVHVITARDEDRIEWARSWLDDHGLKSNIVGISSSNGSRKLDIAETIGAAALLDDDLRHLVDIPKDKVRTWYLARNLRVTDKTVQGIIHVRNWRTVVRFASEIILRN